MTSQTTTSRPNSKPSFARSRKERKLRLLRERERRRSSADPRRFIERHVQIETRSGEPIPFLFWAFQIEALLAIHVDGQVVVLKARQLGLSWLALAYALWLAIFKQGSRIVILCKNDDDAKELLARVRRMLERLATSSPYLVEGLTGGAESASQLGIGRSVIRSVVGKPRSIRSEAAALVILDEFAFTDAADGIWRAALPAADRLICISTGNGAEETRGQGAEFAKQYTRAASGESGFKSLFFPWHVHPQRDEAWKTRELARLGDPDRFAVEYPETVQDAFRTPDVVSVYDAGHIAAAEKLGREMDANPPDADAVKLAIDWGEQTSAGLIAVPLARGGFYIPPGELIRVSTEAQDFSAELIRRGLEVGPVDECFYDAAGGQANNSFTVVGDPLGITTYGIAFSTRKYEAVNYLKLLLRRTAEGKDSRVLAISPHNTTLLAQLRGLRYDHAGKIVKKDDHAPDALICAVSTTARRHEEAIAEDLD